MKGIYFWRKPVPRYIFTWDVSCVLKYLSSLFPLESLSLKLFTMKVTALITLAAAPRAQTLVSVNIGQYGDKAVSVSFLFSRTAKVI